MTEGLLMARGILLCVHERERRVRKETCLANYVVCGNWSTVLLLQTYACWGAHLRYWF
jgi:hypothetical protein